MPPRRLILACLLAALAGAAPAQDLPPLAGPVVLTVTGLDPAEFPGGRLELDLPMLRAMGATRITTSTLWTEGSHTYTGVLLKTLAGRIKSGDHALRFHALNDYSIEIPASDATDEAPLLAYEVDGAVMSVRDKGPLWLIYPFDAGVEYRTDTIYSRSIWQLDGIEVQR
jgi:hypothetical protein